MCDCDYDHSIEIRDASGARLLRICWKHGVMAERVR